VNGTLISTSTALTAVPQTLSVGQTLTLTATVTPSSGPTPAGMVNFSFTGPISIAPKSAALSTSGVATVTISTLPVGVYHVYASYGGSFTDAASKSSPPHTVTVTLPATTTSLTASPNPGAFGAAVTFKATVSNSTLTPTGSVSFYDGKTLLETETLASGTATYTTSTLRAGSHNMTAVYAPTASFSPSTSNLVVEVISIDSFSIEGAPAARTVYTGEAASYLIVVTPISGFNLPVTPSCTHLPANTSCSFSPATITGSSWSTTLMVQTTAPSPPTTSTAVSSGYRVTALAALFLIFIPWRMRRNRSIWTTFILILALLAASAAITGCGGSGTLTGGTPVGAQSITITGTASNGANTLSQETTVAVNVQSLF